jgi:hypothetical protein
MAINLKEALLSMSGTSRLASTLVDRLNALDYSEYPVIESTSSSEEDVNNMVDTILSELERSGTESTYTRISEAFVYLLSVIDDLQSELTELRNLSETSAIYEESTEEQVSDFKSNFLKSLHRGQISYLKQFYDRKQFLEMKPATRAVVADCLLEYCNDLNKKPSELWVSLAANNGHFS